MQFQPITVKAEGKRENPQNKCVLDSEKCIAIWCDPYTSMENETPYS